MPIVSSLRPAVLAAKEKLSVGREKLKRRHLDGGQGLQVCASITDVFDEVLLDLYEAALNDLGDERLRTNVALVAHGGYGRRDVAPYSDVDLMILYEAIPAQRVVPLAERLTRDVFDATAALGHSVRTPEQACEDSRHDATIFSSLAESRYLVGSVNLYRRFVQKFSRLSGRRSLIAAIEAARAEERHRYGETVYLLEPNIKRSPGGLRDLQLIRWIGFAAYGACDLDVLQRQGALSKTDFQTLRRALEFLLRLRNEMHFHAETARDVLHRAEQVRIASAWGYSGDESLLPVERFMREYFQHTNAVSNISMRFARSARPASKVMKAFGPLFSHRVGSDYRVGPMQITATRTGLAKLNNLTEILRLADLANQYNKRIDHNTLEAVRNFAHQMGDNVGEAAKARFLSILDQPLRLGEILHLLHEMEVLEKLVPAFQHARCLLQFNEYHKFTVDEHCIRAVAEATNFLSEPGPLGRAYRRIKQKRLLHLALLLHDLGKGYPRDHSEVGEELAETTCVRLGLSPRETAIVKFLVRYHLMMSHLAFRRDIGESQLVVQFAFDVESPDVLRMLYVLTAADLAAVGPGVLNDWKVEILTTLYQQTMHHLSGENILIGRVEAARNRLREAVADEADQAWFQAQVAALPDTFFFQRDAELVATELKQLHDLPPDSVVATATYSPDTGATAYIVGTHENVAPGIFHKLAGALTGHGLEILSAEINTLAKGLVVDRFFVHDPDFPGEPPASRTEEVTQALEKALRQQGPPSFRKIWTPSERREVARLTQLPARVGVDNNSSDRYTIIDVFATDRQGLLYVIAHTLYQMELSVWVAKIATYLDQVVDVFYVTDFHGNKVTDQERIDHLRARLLAAIGEGG